MYLSLVHIPATALELLKSWRNMDNTHSHDESGMPSDLNNTKTIIPEPRGLPIIGHITLMDSEYPLGSLNALADQYGTPLLSINCFTNM